MKTLSLEQMEVINGGACEKEHAAMWVAAIGWAASFGTGFGAVIGAAGYATSYAFYMDCILKHTSGSVVSSSEPSFKPYF